MVSGSVGSCTPIARGGTPHNASLCTTSTTCGFIGKCDGAGGCLAQPSTVECSPPECISIVMSSAGYCDGVGGCSAAVDRSCAPYMCASTNTTCRSSCTTNLHCAHNAFCLSGRCVYTGTVPVISSATITAGPFTGGTEMMLHMSSAVSVDGYVQQHVVCHV